jgi:hypothetical protein
LLTSDRRESMDGWVDADAKLAKAAHFRVAQILGGRRAEADADLVSG